MLFTKSKKRSHKFPDNTINNARYTWYSFVPIVLFDQFKYFFNLAFLKRKSACCFASILKVECPNWKSNLKHYPTCTQINCYCGPNGNSWAGPPTNLHDKKLSNQGLSMNIHSICKIAYVKVWHCLFSHNFFKDLWMLHLTLFLIVRYFKDGEFLCKMILSLHN